jgi:hypothetical protein
MIELILGEAQLIHKTSLSVKLLPSARLTIFNRIFVEARNQSLLILERTLMLKFNVEVIVRSF